MPNIVQQGLEVVEWLQMQDAECVGDTQFYDLDDFIAVLFPLVDESTIHVQLRTQECGYAGDDFQVADVSFLSKGE